MRERVRDCLFVSCYENREFGPCFALLMVTARGSDLVWMPGDGGSRPADRFRSCTVKKKELDSQPRRKKKVAAKVAPPLPRLIPPARHCSVGMSRVLVLFLLVAWALAAQGTRRRGKCGAQKKKTRPPASADLARPLTLTPTPFFFNTQPASCAKRPTRPPTTCWPPRQPPRASRQPPRRRRSRRRWATAFPSSTASAATTRPPSTARWGRALMSPSP